MSETTDDQAFVIDPAGLLRMLVIAVAALAILSLASQALLYLPDFTLRDLAADLFSVDHERSVPTLFSAVLLLSCGYLAFVVARLRSSVGGDYVRHWVAFSLLLIYTAVDEFVSLHERSILLLRRLLDIDSGPFFFAWVIPALVFVCVVALAFVGFLKNLPSPSRRWMLLGATALVGGAIGVEMVAGIVASAQGQEALVYMILTTIEETLEMLGAALVWCAVLAYLGAILPGGRAGFRIVGPDNS
ncbi:MAG TPA: hypothetical protein VE174_12165 [Actinomycetota bacterium]|nr:hypothetical protein [Actinomycetota bacterium]